MSSTEPLKQSCNPALPEVVEEQQQQ